ncbi:type IV toxin-antitoxin system AbiEi family antitoxin [Cryptosporangium sp. NPDC051539]|uniref:type IV toxin-antitoxin system AbiEi family antitoxin n=1 Tax=Cryptosporangium sp. NPDC051539 TaxID=3363962 RepID=UPI003790C4CB
MESLPEVIAYQRGLVLRSQALATGLTDAAIDWRISRGTWRRALPGLVATFTGEPTPEQWLTGACLYGGRDSQVTGTAALRWHGARYVPADALTSVLIPAERRRASCGFVRIIRTTRLDPHALVRNGLTVCSVARAAADAARAGHAVGDTRALLADLVQRGLTSIERLETELTSGPVRGSAVLRRVLSELRDGSAR